MGLAQMGNGFDFGPFFGYCRIGEIFQARRADLLTPSDLFRTDGRFFLRIRDPKSRGRGARVQYKTIQLEPDIAAFMMSTAALLRPSESLYFGNPNVYRRHWDRLMISLGVPLSLRITPGSVRGGGAVAAYQNGALISELQWQMRLRNQNTLAYYLQEISAGSVLPALPRRARELIAASVVFFPFALLTPPSAR